MDQIYSLDNGNKLVLYTLNTNLYIHTLPLQPAAKPMLLSTDYERMLHSCTYHETLYYAYINTSHNLLLISMNPKETQTVLNDEANIFDYHIYSLFSLSNTALFLLVAMKNPISNNYTLKLIAPTAENKTFTIADNIQPDHNIFPINISNSTMLLYINETQKFIKITINEKELPVIKEMSTPCDNCLKLQEQLSSVTTQYNELMETALKIQSEGKHWRELYEKQKNVFK